MFSISHHSHHRSVPVRAAWRRLGAVVALVLALPVVTTHGQDAGGWIDDVEGPISPFVAKREISEGARQVSEYIREVFQDRTGMIWFGTNGDGVVQYDGTGLTYLSLDEGFGGDAVRGIVEAPDGAVWFATDRGVSRYTDGAWTNYTVDDGLLHHSTWSIECDRAGTIWVGTHAGVCRFDGSRFQAFPLPRVDVDSSLSRFSPLVSFAIHEDDAGHLWFATDGEGVHRWDGTSFTSFSAADGLGSNVVRCVTSDRHGNIWIGSNGGGICRFDGTTFTRFTTADGLPNDRIYEVYETRDGMLWMSTLGEGICRFDGTTFTAFPPDPNVRIDGRPSRTHVQEFFEDRDGVLWLGCSGGLFRKDGETFVNVRRGGPWPTSPESEMATP